MSIWNTLVGLFHRSAQAAVAGPAKAVTGVVKDVSGATKDVTGIRKDLVETELAKVELKEKTSLVHAATFEDVKHFDQKVSRLTRDIEAKYTSEHQQLRRFPFGLPWLPWICLLALIMAPALFVWMFGIWTSIRIALYVAGGSAIVVLVIRIYIWFSERKQKQAS